VCQLGCVVSLCGEMAAITKREWKRGGVWAVSANAIATQPMRVAADTGILLSR